MNFHRYLAVAAEKIVRPVTSGIERLSWAQSELPDG